jgi:3-hydroxyacyl-CoA dehydrogenase
MGIAQRSFTDEEILRRLLFASVNEACKILEEAKAHRASDIDVMWLKRLRLPALSRRADVLGRRHRR